MSETRATSINGTGGLLDDCRSEGWYSHDRICDRLLTLAQIALTCPAATPGAIQQANAIIEHLLRRRDDAERYYALPEVTEAFENARNDGSLPRNYELPVFGTFGDVVETDEVMAFRRFLRRRIAIVRGQSTYDA